MDVYSQNYEQKELRASPRTSPGTSPRTTPRTTTRTTPKNRVTTPPKGLLCYQCNSNTNLNCNDPFASHVPLKDCKIGQCCAVNIF